MPNLQISELTFIQSIYPSLDLPTFWKEVSDQLNKDMASDISLGGGDLNPDKAAEEITVKLEGELPQIIPRISEALYRVDLHEDALNELRGLPIDIYFRRLAELVLLRVAQKVLTRMLLARKQA